MIRQDGIEKSFFRIISNRKIAVAEDIPPRTGRQTELKASWQMQEKERVTEFKRYVIIKTMQEFWPGETAALVRWNRSVSRACLLH